MYLKSRDFEVTVPSLLFEPEYYVFDFSADASTTRFLVTSEQNLDMAPFIDIRYEPLAQARFSIETRQLLSLEAQHDIARPPLHFIFHHAFVCSTLLARSLGQSEAFFSLKEPWILRRLADSKRGQRSPLPASRWQALFRLYTALLAKNYRGGGVPVIKATNVANNLLDDVLTLRPDSKAVYLYSDLDAFLVSNLKKPPDTQQRIPSLLEGFLRDSDFASRFPQYANPGQFSLLQLCALIWITNLYMLSQAAARHGEQALLLVHMDDLLAEPAMTLGAISRHFGHAPSAADLAAMTDRSVWDMHAKNPGQRYSRDVRTRETGELLKLHGSQVEATRAWIEPLAEDLGIPAFLSQIRHAR